MERKITKALRRFVVCSRIYERQLQTRVCLLNSSRTSLCSLEGLFTDARAVEIVREGVVIHYRYTRTTRGRTRHAGCGGGTVCSRAPLVGPDPNMPSSVYRWSILNKLQTQKKRHGVHGRRARESGDHTTTPPSSRTAGSGRFSWGGARRRPPVLRQFRGAWLIPRVPYSGLVPQGEQTVVPATRPHEGDMCEDVFEPRSGLRLHAQY